ncbi:hypothetical protein Csa_013517 [Cucumis sativus]|uniref:Uncharacterized protein n=1 Tax=Cucumis sativus TaxID=3659 RepID=A0A0A0LQ42_CUCSA|nr:hypothetical protein Csa_013517 [Cucumis sativus]
MHSQSQLHLQLNVQKILTLSMVEEKKSGGSWNVDSSPFVERREDLNYPIAFSWLTRLNEHPIAKVIDPSKEKVMGHLMVKSNSQIYKSHS